MIGIKFFVDNKRRIVEAISEPYIRKYSSNCDSAFVVVKDLSNNSVEEGAVHWLGSIPTDAEFEEWNNA